MYMSYLLLIVEYASVVWDSCSEEDLHYKRACHMINEICIITNPVQRVWMGNSITKKTITQAFFYV